ncbi:MAG: hypothetical protein K2P57_02600 [Burkholderiales bacterium]|nr:hypothetical protein [Burkholderiales bacterium]
MTILVNNEFAKWATGFSGFDGGNPKGSVWLCGFECAGTPNEDDLVFEDVTTPGYVAENRGQFLRGSQYNLKAVKLLAALAGRDTRDYEPFFNEESCFNRDSNYFKLNLYPIGFKNTKHEHWADWITQKTGFTTKQEYLEWCREKRFPMFRDWILTYSPSLIICTGKTYATQFQSAFGSGTEKVFTEEVAGKEIKYFRTNDNKTTVVIIYFLGTQYGLKSDEEISLTGKKIAELVEKHGEFDIT